MATDVRGLETGLLGLEGFRLAGRVEEDGECWLRWRPPRGCPVIFCPLKEGSHIGKTTAVQHPNAAANLNGRLKMMKLITEKGWPAALAAERFQTTAKTVSKWRDRYLAEGPGGLLDQSSRPRSSPAQTPAWTSEQQHTRASNASHHYNHHRPHATLNWATPINTLQALTGDNLPEPHT